MQKIILVICCWLLVTCSLAQSISAKLATAFQQFENDPQLKHAVSSLYVIDAKTGKVAFDKNSQTGLAPASTQKIITSVTAFELLGKDYRYKTEMGYDGKIEKGILNGNLYLVGSGDPTFGSWRFNSTKRDSILNKILLTLKNKGIKEIRGNIIFDNSKFSFQPLPGGWIWEDIGNYYGAGTWAFNWNENQYDLLLKPGNKEGDSVEITGTDPELENSSIINFLKSGKPGSGDNGYIYWPPYSYAGFIEGTVPAGEKKFIISGSMSIPQSQFEKEIKSFLGSDFKTHQYKWSEEFITDKQPVPHYKFSFSPIYSPSLDSIIYWFLKRSINLYGEALVKTFAYEKQKFGSTDSGVAIIKDFWKQKGLDEDELNICDGSGLSPLNRVTTHAQVEILKYAKAKDWFQYFYNALPEYNGMKMKSGTIRDVKSFCGYQTSKDGNEYIFSFIVNNYNGSTSEVVNKMYKVLDNLK